MNRVSLHFPPPELALEEPNGLLAIGGDLSIERLLCAYRQGIFPWYEGDGPILWWSPDPRGLLCRGDLRITASLRKVLRKGRFRFSLNSAFDSVIDACAEPRDGSRGTWITRAMRDAYCELHRRGYAHSIEVWDGHRLVGGLYGLLVGRVFCGESMFSRVSDASKCAFVALTNLAEQLGLSFIDCQLPNPHLESLGVRAWPRAAFLKLLADASADAAPTMPNELPDMGRTPWAA